MSAEIITLSINKLCKKDYGIFVLIFLIPIIIGGLLMLSALEWLQDRGYITIPVWLAWIIITSSLNIFHISLIVAIHLYDPTQNAINCLIHNYNRLQMNSLLNGGIIIKPSIVKIN
jgi:hypothetical protein